ncbi:2-C-methyl-D-erythritol 4-phosphate cytidylyltransferase [Candidatus Kaiserbacteria bacterium]|nr:2-C-methyl-D-erythritol 4-phosphate cytidylyltransferase [Candidatus Kaiserbacteria bacterium]
MKRKVGAVILAAGLGSRIGKNLPKQFLEIGGKEIYIYSVETFLAHEDISNVVVVAPPAKLGHVRHTMLKSFGAKARLRVVAGGATRRASCLAGIRAMDRTLRGNDLVVFHDAVRPFMTERHLSVVIRAAAKHGSAIIGTKPPELLVVVEGGRVTHSTHRKIPYFLYQTPECFHFRAIRDAHARMPSGVDATNLELMLHAGKTVPFVLIDDFNTKLTYAGDIPVFRTLLRGQKGLRAAS